jgi:hypothetical protein
MTLYQLRSYVARAEVESSLGTLLFATLAQGRCYAEGLANAGQEAVVRDRWLHRKRIGDYYPAGAFLPLRD